MRLYRAEPERQTVCTLKVGRGMPREVRGQGQVRLARKVIEWLGMIARSSDIGVAEKRVLS